MYARHADVAAMGRRARRLSHGSMRNEYARRPTPTTATTANNSGHRVVRIKSLRILVVVSKPTSGRNRPKASNVVMPASRNARLASTRFSCAPVAISNLFDVGPAEQPLRQEDQSNCQHRESGNILVVDGKICRPKSFDQTDQNTADHSAGQRADAAKHRRGESLEDRKSTRL